MRRRARCSACGLKRKDRERGEEKLRSDSREHACRAPYFWSATAYCIRMPGCVSYRSSRGLEPQDLGALTWQGHFVADTGANQRLRDRRDPADETLRRICFVFTDEREAALRAVFVAHCHA